VAVSKGKIIETNQVSLQAGSDLAENLAAKVLILFPSIGEAHERLSRMGPPAETNGADIRHEFGRG
jgi:hypothetical protein